MRRLNVTRDELMRFMPKVGLVAEVGVNQGAFAKVIARECAPAWMVLVDHWPDGVPEACLAPLKAAVPRLDILHQKSVEAASQCRGIGFNMVYIDADHSYESCLADLEAWAPTLAPDGLLLAHDYYRDDGVAKDFGVIEAVETFCERHGWQRVALTQEAFNTVVLAPAEVGDAWLARATATGLR